MNTLCFDEDGTQLFSGDSFGIIIIWNVSVTDKASSKGYYANASICAAKILSVGVWYHWIIVLMCNILLHYSTLHVMCQNRVLYELMFNWCKWAVWFSFENPNRDAIARCYDLLPVFWFLKWNSSYELKFNFSGLLKEWTKKKELVDPEIKVILVR